MKVLILAYDFPPFGSVGGLRPYAWYRYLGRHGVEPVVVTRQWSDRYGDHRDYVAPSPTDRVEVERTGHGTLLRTPYAPNLANRLLLEHGPDRYRTPRRVVTGCYEVGQWLAPVGPRAGLLRAARGYLAEHGADAIVATGEPFVLFRYASELSRAFAIPWIADYRDAWSQDKRRGGAGLGRPWHTALERRFTASASVLTTVSDSVRDVLARLHPGKRIEVLPNGYDPEAMAAADGIEQGTDRFTIAFTGTVYGWHPLESVLRVLQELVREHDAPPLELLMVGVGQRDSIEAMLRARYPGLAPHVRFLPRLPNDAMARELARANAFLLFNNYAYTGTKIYDYLALGRRILLCYSDDPEAAALRAEHYNLDVSPGTDDRALERILEETRSGVVVRDARHLERVLGEWHAELRRTGRLECRPVGTERYSRATRTGRLAELLKEIAG